MNFGGVLRYIEVIRKDELWWFIRVYYGDIYRCFKAVP